MGVDWKNTRLKDVTSILSDGLHGTPKYDNNGDYYFINGNNLSNGKIVIDKKTKRASKEEYLKYKKNLNNRTIFVSINGTLGNVALYNGEKVFLGKSACYFNIIEGVDKHFIRYVVSNSVFQNYIHSLATGSTIKNVSLKLMRDFTFRLPPIESQKKISKVLKALYDKIELNRQTNKTLEAMAQAIFKSWFVDFDPVIDKALAVGNEIPDALKKKADARIALGDDRKLLPEDIRKLFPDSFVFTEEMGWVPEEWEIKTINDVAEIIGGGTPSRKKKEFFCEKGISWLSPKDLSGYTWKHIGKGATDITEEALGKSSARLMPKGTVLFSSRAPIGYIAIAEKELSTNQGFKSLVSKKTLCSEFLFNFMKVNKGRIESIATGSTFKEVSGSALKKLTILVPPVQLIKCYEKNSIEVNCKFLNLQKQTEILTNLRDTLLPKLLSGELRIPDAEKLIED